MLTLQEELLFKGHNLQAKEDELANLNLTLASARAEAQVKSCDQWVWLLVYCIVIGGEARCGEGERLRPLQ